MRDITEFEVQRYGPDPMCGLRRDSSQLHTQEGGNMIPIGTRIRVIINPEGATGLVGKEGTTTGYEGADLAVRMDCAVRIPGNVQLVVNPTLRLNPDSVETINE